MSNVIKFDFQGHAVSFTDDGWFNATKAAKAFRKRPAEWLRLPDTNKYIEAKMRRSKVGFSHFAYTKRGGADGEGLEHGCTRSWPWRSRAGWTWISQPGATSR